MNIDETIQRLNEIKSEHGNIPVYFLYDSFVEVPVSRIEFGEKTKDYTIEKDPIPERCILMCPADADDWDGGQYWLDDEE